MAERIFISSCDPWKVEETGLTGWTAWYLNNYRDGDNGYKPTKVNVPDELAKGLIGKLPCLVNADYGSRPGPQGKAALTIVALEIVAPVDFPAFLNATPKKL